MGPATDIPFARRLPDRITPDLTSLVVHGKQDDVGAARASSAQRSCLYAKLTKGEPHEVVKHTAKSGRFRADGPGRERPKEKHEVIEFESAPSVTRGEDRSSKCAELRRRQVLCGGV